VLTTRNEGFIMPCSTNARVSVTSARIARELQVEPRGVEPPTSRVRSDVRGCPDCPRMSTNGPEKMALHAAISGHWRTVADKRTAPEQPQDLPAAAARVFL